tara:strand:+ start:3045 stop:3290 length:246 start_codon:yes stop_codon:yes gene_type:complete
LVIFLVPPLPAANQRKVKSMINKLFCLSCLVIALMFPKPDLPPADVAPSYVVTAFSNGPEVCPEHAQPEDCSEPPYAPQRA